jgi:acyl-CoA synthetase (AMP-forming)/AMP-acid ligase II
MTRQPGVGTWIERRARVAGDHTALIFGDTSRTYADLARRVRRLANGLRSLGVQRGDRVAWLGANHPAFLEALFASATLGAALAPISHRLDPDVIDELIAAAAPRVVLVGLTDGRLRPPALPARVEVTVEVGPWDAGDCPYERLIAGHADAAIDEPVEPDDLCLLPFTSGTTGRPKGVMLTQANLTWNVLNGLSCLDVRGDDVTIAVAPFFRTGGTGVNVLPVLFQGGTVVIPETTAPDEVFGLIARHRVTIGFGNPDLLDALTRSPLWPIADLASLRVCVIGGAPVPERLLRAYHERDVQLLQGYGLSEAAPLVSVLDAASAPRKLGSAGRPVMFVDTRIAGPDGTDRTAGQIGELLVRGPNVMAGYWKRPDATRRVFDEHGWLRTGDAAFADADGCLFIVGRMEDAYVVAGEIVHPGLAERVLLQHPSVAEACVLGGEQGAVAYVVRAGGAPAEIESDLLALCRDRLAPSARPDAIRFVGGLPRSTNGKILRRELSNRTRSLGRDLSR